MAVGISLHGQIEPRKQGQYRYVLIRTNIWKAGVPKFGRISKNLNLFRKQLQVDSIDQLELVTNVNYAVYATSALNTSNTKILTKKNKNMILDHFISKNTKNINKTN